MINANFMLLFSCQLSVVSCQLSVVSRQSLVVSCQEKLPIDETDD
ncbi:hypothetical protein ACE1CD_03065 [Aerosakkonema sp. BLCC-F183]